ncbi:DUF2236 domain-containing protein [Pseudenhygromyxa sp. WMMC2535]|uniref:oxygenase MpaB family protein n=1 Tax=Pseudenhygromyxa sp. WMMC2535 TaxID=2712867 RepID=UPI001595C179|nr:oxygenase MpaB family protein [Pseudenhygromyxa sp. WMMC2535]NVB41515.1 DUF2236 domain-containing protein [Pseudenhygromyxa sp. WMMC2535]
MSSSFDSQPFIPSRFREPLEGDSWRLRAVRRLLRLPPPTSEQLSRVRDTLCEGDPLADALAERFEAIGAAQGRRLLTRAIEDGIERVPEAPEPLVALFAALDRRPAWVDDAKLELATEVAGRVGMSGLQVLSCVSLTGGYRSSAANKPIALTGALESMAYRRLAETSKFVLELYDSPTLARDSAGFRAAVMVRALHALVRARLRADPRWRAEDWGLPINQADMLGTNMLFSTVFVLGLRALGHVITGREADALVHFWRYVGYLMGIREDLLPEDFDAACQLVCLSLATQPPSDEDSRALAQALLSVPLSPGLGASGQRLELAWRASFSRLMLGERECDELGLPHGGMKWAVLLSALGNAATEALRLTIPGAGEVIARQRRAQVRRVVERSLAGVAPSYQPYPGSATTG